MTTRSAFALALLLGLLVFAETAAGHHSFAGVYDGTRSVTVSGVVTQFKFVNPHALMYMDVVDASGKVAKWTIEFAGRLNLSEGGWTAETIKAKERVTVTGNPTRTPEEARMFFVKLTRADGSELVNTSAERLNSVEEERRERARQRSQQK
jgi:Family of unknown function (DUF6152)